MLFDLRSRGRRRTVQAVYLGLAVIMAGGLILVGVGTGSGGGILNAFTGGGGGGGTQAVNQDVKNALRQTRLQPNNPAAWAALVQARWSNANQGSNFDTSTGTYTAGGKQELAHLATAWERYLKLTPHPDPNVAILAARAYGQIGNFAAQANAWDIQTLAEPGQPKGYICLAMASYAAKQTRKGDLAAAKALSMVPKASRTPVKQQINQAKTNPQIAATC